MFTLLNTTWEFRDVIMKATAGELSQIRKLLDLFQRAVTSYKRDEIHDTTVSELSQILDLTEEQTGSIVSGYTRGIRNSSDLGSRRMRHIHLKSLLSRKLKA
ncbi:hypothetical protein A5780_28315 [Nocardia sp. 852002-20019_SCH5090214]|nr:hypothetical protein A5780_28315 [Nocardia sp. 852002-20019_SCH5090214]